MDPEIISYRPSQSWNMVPAEIKQSSSLSTFKEKVIKDPPQFNFRIKSLIQNKNKHHKNYQSFEGIKLMFIVTKQIELTPSAVSPLIK